MLAVIPCNQGMQLWYACLDHMQLQMQLWCACLDPMQIQMQLRYACLDHMQSQMQLRYACFDPLLHLMLQGKAAPGCNVTLSEHALSELSTMRSLVHCSLCFPC